MQDIDLNGDSMRVVYDGCFYKKATNSDSFKCAIVDLRVNIKIPPMRFFYYCKHTHRHNTPFHRHPESSRIHYNERSSIRYPKRPLRHHKRHPPPRHPEQSEGSAFGF